MNIFSGIYAFYKSAAPDAFTLNKSEKKIVLRRTLMLNHLSRKYFFTTLKSLRDEQTGINEQVWEKNPPDCFFTSRVEFFVYYMKNCKQDGKKI